MDGTLTLPRMKIQKDMYNTLGTLTKRGHTICVVSGSPLSYIKEQLRVDELDYEKTLWLMPCNGTQVFKRMNSVGLYECVYSVTMGDFLDSTSDILDPYRELVANILELQLYALRRYNFRPRGNFVSDRGSMVNWSMIGRDASHEVRDAFSAEDKAHNLRRHLRDCLRVRLDASDLHGIDLALGGSTSIDIFPTGWDKTYALKHLDPELDPWFWGDKCMSGGNDHTLYKKLGERRAFSVETPEDTLASVRALQDAGTL